MPDSPSTTRLTREQFIERSKDIVPIIEAHAAQGERDRMVAPEIIAAIRDGGYFQLLQPKQFGGYEYDMATVVRCLLNWSAADASAAWVAGLGIIHQWIIALFPIECQQDVWGENTDIITFGSYAPGGECVLDGDGFRLTGAWPYASGCMHGDWGLMGAIIPSLDPDAPPSPGFVILPASDYSIDQTWDPMGLAATGSHTMVCDQAYVPRHRSITFAELASGEAPGYLVHQSNLYRYPLLSLIAYSIACPAVGCLAGALDRFSEDTKSWKTRGAVVRGGANVADYQSVQMRVGSAAGALKAAKAMLFTQLEESRQTVLERGERLTLEERLDNRLTQAYIIDLAVKGLEELWGAAGGTGVQRTQYVQRAWRDAHAIQHHVSFNWDAITSMYGQHLLGLEPQGQY